MGRARRVVVSLNEAQNLGRTNIQEHTLVSRLTDVLLECLNSDAKQNRM